MVAASALLAFAAGFAQPAIPTCLPVFPDDPNWHGGDVGAAVPLSKELGARDVWLFGDTYWGPDRANSPLISNTIAISGCDARNQWSIRYFSGPSGGPFFDVGSDKTWPMGGFLTRHGTLYVAVSRNQKIGDGPFGYAGKGVSLVRVDNPGADPSNWKMSNLNLSNGDAVFPGVFAVQPGDGKVYLGGLRKDDSVILTRIPEWGLNAPDQNIEVLTKDQTWKRGLDQNVANAAVIIPKAASQMSVHYERATGNWVATWLDFGSNTLVTSTAGSLSGPWSPAQPLLHIAAASNTFCYSGFAHPEYGSDTFVCSSADSNELNGNPNLYRPQAVALR